MALVDKIWLHNFGATKMRVYVKLHPSGEVSMEVPLPEAFRLAIMKIAQTAADQHEAQMQAQLLGENAL